MSTAKPAYAVPLKNPTFYVIVAAALIISAAMVGTFAMRRSCR